MYLVVPTLAQAVVEIMEAAIQAVDAARAIKLEVMNKVFENQVRRIVRYMREIGTGEVVTSHQIVWLLSEVCPSGHSLSRELSPGSSVYSWKLSFGSSEPVLAAAPASPSGSAS